MFILHIALQGCLRSAPVAYGVTPDTGGHIRYVLELCDANEKAGVERQLIVTRRFDDPKIGQEYGQRKERVSRTVEIARIDGACTDYRSKEELAREHQELSENFLRLIDALDPKPDLIHAHYADAGILAIAARERFDIPFVFTPHSLGRAKAESSAEGGICPELETRIETEERVIGAADRVIVSSRDEAEHQVALYRSQKPERIILNPPGCDGGAFTASRHQPQALTNIHKMVEPSLRDPSKPPIIALARPVRKKNLAALVHAYGQSPELQEHANLAIFAGVRDDLAELDEEGEGVIAELLYLQDKYDLYGKLALPKQHAPEDVPAIYRWAASLGGLFCNPALNEPFGLTLLEAAAAGLPVISTNRGGPLDIVGRLRHGRLVDPQDHAALGEAAHDLLTDEEAWSAASRNGSAGVSFFAWDRHASDYIRDARSICGSERPPLSDMIGRNFMVVSDIDDTLVGERESLRAFAQWRQTTRGFHFAIATGRSLQDAIRVLKEWDAPFPEVLITSVGSEIYYAHDLELRALSSDEEWSRHISQNWSLSKIDRALVGLRGLVMQPPYEQRRFKRSYFTASPDVAGEVKAQLGKAGLGLTVIHSHGEYLDILPRRASKGQALAWLAKRLDIPIQHTLAAGDSGNDVDLLMTAGMGVVVANHGSELLQLKTHKNAYFAQRPFAGGILEGLARFAP